MHIIYLPHWIAPFLQEGASLCRQCDRRMDTQTAKHWILSFPKVEVDHCWLHEGLLY